MSDIEELIQKLKLFRDERDWKQFHNSKDLAIALSIEASELLEAFLWKTHDQVDHRKIKEELADVFAYALLLAESCDLDVKKIIEEKIEINKQKYPIEKSKGSGKKYTDL
ncbi:MazG Predicted pyrophosphatase [Candidatus Methylopumilus universalis]|jgi:NTP pyrophosphatase (non-canonical NTP hydrolase)|uniref:nucleotide pyrophosphohydrolase n=1 Tax=Candidatus Methylopumilus universalis TaxID=2588536 RepID=UPI003BEF00E8